MFNVKWSNVLVIGVSIIATMISFNSLFNKLNLRIIEIDEKEIQNDNMKKVSFDNKESVLDLMLRNVSELREYYIISKNQANRAFVAAVTISFIGIILYASGIISFIYFKTDIVIISTIGGTTVQIISGLFFWIYNKSIKQLNVYHSRLISTEKYLTAIQLIDKVPEDKKYEEYRNIINYLLNDNQAELKQASVIEK